MTMDDKLSEALRARFDAGEDLTPELREELAKSPEAAAYWQRLQGLDMALWSLPLEAPSPDLAARLQHGVARDREMRMWRRTAGLSTVAVLIALALFAGWRYPQYASPEAWWYTVSELLPEQAWLENTTPLEAQVALLLTTVEGLWQDTIAFPWTISLWALTAAVFVLVVFNATGARAMRVAGRAGGDDTPHHV